MTTLATKLQKRKEELLELDKHPIVDGDYYLSKCIGIENDNRYVIEIHSVQKEKVLLTEKDFLICCSHDFWGHDLTELDFVRMVQDKPWFFGKWKHSPENAKKELSAYLASDRDEPAFIEFKSYMDCLLEDKKEKVLAYIAKVDGE